MVWVRMHIRPLGFVGILASLAAGLTVALTTSTSSATEAQISPTLLQYFPILGQSNIDTPPFRPGFLDTIGQTGTPDSDLGLIPARALYVSTSSGGMWLVPGTNGMCVIQMPDASGQCGPASGFVPGSSPHPGVAIVGHPAYSNGQWTPANKSLELYGMLPAGWSTISVVKDNGVPDTVSVSDEVFDITDLMPNSVAQIQDASGQTMETIPLRTVTSPAGPAPDS
jgi:hypothetical protein